MTTETPAALGTPAADASPLINLSPAYFALVMTTGIIGIGLHLMGHPRVAMGFLVLNTLQYAILWLLFLLRAWRYPRHFFGDLVDHAKGAGYFTIVAGTGLLASQYMVQLGDYRTGTALWVVCALLWVLIIYSMFSGFIIKRDKPTLLQGINGAWLLIIVGTQSVSVTSTLLAGAVSAPWQLGLTFLALCAWLLGGVLYTWVMGFILYRYLFLEFSASDMKPPYWIDMGAMAISTLAGATLILSASSTSPLLQAHLHFIKAFTLLYWVTGTWWIPLLIILDVWRYVIKRYPFRYSPLYWGAAFPLGMYTACTWQLSRALDLDFLQAVSHVFIVIALTVWTITFLAMLRNAARGIFAAAHAR